MTKFTKRQQEIIDASVDILSKGGIQELTIKNISKKVGISEPAIYRHFKCKMDILLAILTFFEDFAFNTLRKIEKMEKVNIRQLEKFMITRFEKISEKPVVATIVFSEEIFRNEKQLSLKIQSIMNAHLTGLALLLTKAMEAGAIRNDVPADKLSHILMGSIRLQIKRWSLGDFSGDLVEAGRELWKAIEILISLPKQTALT